MSFYFFCHFWRIAHRTASGLYRFPGPICRHVPLVFAESQLCSLMEWAEDLPSEAQRTEHMPHNVCEMQYVHRGQFCLCLLMWLCSICYHATIMDLCRPFLTRDGRLANFVTSTHWPEVIFQASFYNLRDLVDTYNAKYAGLPQAYTIAWVHGPMYLAPATLYHDRDPGWQSRVIHSLEVFRDLLQAHAALDVLLRALLGMAMSAGMFDVSDATELLDELKMKRRGAHLGVPEAGFVVDHARAVEKGHASATGSVLAQDFDNELFREALF